jgi:sulfocyanin
MRQSTAVIVATLLLGAVNARAQSAVAAKIDPTWVRVVAATKTAEFQLVAGLSAANGGMNFNGFDKGGLTLTVPLGWNVVIHFKNEDQNLPHSVEIISDTTALPLGPVRPAFEKASTGKLEQGFSAGQGNDFRFLAAKDGSFLIFCAVPGHGAAGMWIRLAVSATADKPTLAATAVR